MKDETFDAIWNQIEENAQVIFQRLRPEGHGFRFIYKDRGKRVIRDEYDRIRAELKARCYEQPLDPESDSHLIDHHKIAACFCKALVTKKLFTFQMDETVSESMLRSNYELAYTVSLRIIYDYLVESYEFEGNSQLKKQLMNQKCLYVPETTPSHEDYNLGRIKTLALNDFYNIEFDLLAYSNTMFWIEHYNRQLLSGQVEVKFPPIRSR